MVAANTSATMLAFSSTLPNGHVAEAYINLSTTSSGTVTTPFTPGSAALTEWQYSNQNPAVTQQAAAPSASMTVPPESVTVLEQ